MSCADGYSMKTVPGCPSYTPSTIVTDPTAVIDFNDPTRIKSSLLHPNYINPTLDSKAAQIYQYLDYRYGREVLEKFESFLYACKYFSIKARNIGFLKLALQAERIEPPADLVFKERYYISRQLAYENLKNDLILQYPELKTYPELTNDLKEYTSDRLNDIKEEVYYKHVMMQSAHKLSSYPINQFSKFL